MKSSELIRIARVLETAAQERASAESHERLSGGFHVEEAHKKRELHT